MTNHPMLMQRDPPPEFDVTRPALPKCWCHDCNEERFVYGLPFTVTRMILCPDCGNKRCPRANWHGHACTNSNEPNQPGSAFVSAPLESAGCTRSHPHELMSQECERKTVAARAAFESAAQAAPEAGMNTGPSQAVEPVAADFKAHDRLMVANKSQTNWIPRKILHGCALNHYLNRYRHPTDAELALHRLDDGWIPWNGGKCPVAFDCEVLIKLVNDEEIQDIGCAFDWNYGDIVAYKVLS